jgi:protein-disulfide isomerase
LASRKEQREEARRQREEREAEERKKQRRKRRFWQVGSVLVVAVAIVVIAIVVSSSGGNNTKVNKVESNKTTQLFAGVGQSGLTAGNPEAKVTLYEFADLQCPFCRNYTVSGPFKQIVDQYVRPGKVKMTWRNLTFIGGDSVTAARAAIAAGNQNKLWDFVDLFYKNQGQENSGYVTDKFIEDVAKPVGLDVNKLKADMSAPNVEAALGTAQTQAQQFGINSTPSFLIQVGNGKPQKVNVDSTNFDSFKQALDKALAQANQ